MTLLEIVNKVLRKLREPTVSIIAGDDYAELITDFLSETKREVEDKTHWSNLDGLVVVQTVSGVPQYTLAGVYERSEVVEVYNRTTKAHLSLNERAVKEGIDDLPVQTGEPMYWRPVGYLNGELQIEVFPVPDKVYDLKIEGKFVQKDLSYSDTTFELLTPEYPLFLGTYAKALEERGDDDGEPVTKAEDKYKKALGDAAILDANLRGDKMIWEVE